MLFFLILNFVSKQWMWLTPVWKKETGSVNDSLRKTLRGCTWGHKVVPTQPVLTLIV